MQIVNNYTKTWHIDGASPVLTRGEGVYNGDMGRIVRISPEERTLHILFDGERIAEYDFEELSQLEHAYAVTVHKSQGSEFETVLLPLYYGRSDFLTRNLFYTAMTRARKKLLLLGREATVRHMIGNAKISQRYTALDHEIKKELEFAENAGVRPLFSREPADRDDLLDLFPEEEKPEYRYTRWEEIPGSLINRQWLCPNFFEIREAMEQLDEPDKEWFFDWCDKCHHDIGSEDPHLLVAHYLELYGNATSTGDDTCPDGDDDSFLYYPGISNNYFDTVIPRFEVFDDNYD